MLCQQTILSQPKQNAAHKTFAVASVILKVANVTPTVVSATNADASVVVVPLNVFRAIAAAFSAVTSAVVALADVIRTAASAIGAAVSVFRIVVSVTDDSASVRLSQTFEPKLRLFLQFPICLSIYRDALSVFLPVSRLSPTRLPVGDSKRIAPQKIPKPSRSP